MKSKNIFSVVVFIAVIAIIIWVVKSDAWKGEELQDSEMVDESQAETQKFSFSDITELTMTVLQEGDGPAIQKGQTAVVHYTGALVDGVIFDSSLTRGVPFEFVLGTGTVIQGWEIGVEGMKVGERRFLAIPPAMAYGNAEIGIIPANSVLLFEVELLEIK